MSICAVNMAVHPQVGIQGCVVFCTKSETDRKPLMDCMSIGILVKHELSLVI